MSTKLDGLIEEYDRIDGSEISHLKEELEEVRDEQDARIAELTAEADALRNMLAVRMEGLEISMVELGKCRTSNHDLTAEMARAKELVEAAYREGFSSGSYDAMQDERGRGGYGVDQLWQISDARTWLKGANRGDV